MNHDYYELRAVLARARSRWRRATLLRGFGVASAAASLLLALALMTYFLGRPTGIALILLAAISVLGILASFASAVWTMRRSPSDRRVARFVEERVPELEDRVATAIEFGEHFSEKRTPIVERVLADAVVRTRELDFERVVSRAAIKRDRKSTRLNSSHIQKSRMPSSA